MNHLEQLVAEWLQYKGYFVRVSIPVGPRQNGGFEGELDVVGFNLKTKHLIHIECSLDALKEEERETRFAAKFERGRRFISSVFLGIQLPKLDQALVLQFSSGRVRKIGGVRLVTVRDFVHEMVDGLKGTSPASKAVSANLPLLRTVQLATHEIGRKVNGEHRLIQSATTENQ